MYLWRIRGATGSSLIARRSVAETMQGLTVAPAEAPFVVLGGSIPLPALLGRYIGALLRTSHAEAGR
jgi:hypothetical protein